MKTRSILPVFLAVVSAGVVVSTAAAQNVPYAISADAQAKTIAPGGSTAFEITITNQSSSAIDLYVERSDVTFPDENWYSSFCFNGSCFDPSMTAPPPAHLEPGGATLLELTVVGMNSVPNQTGIVKVRFSNFLGSNATVKEYTVSVNNGAGVISEAPRAAQTIAYPNPATGYTHISIPAAMKGARDLSASLFNTRGERVADLSDAARNAVTSGSDGFGVDLAGLQNGAYFYTITSGSASAKGSLVVVH